MASKDPISIFIFFLFFFLWNCREWWSLLRFKINHQITFNYWKTSWTIKYFRSWIFFRCVSPVISLPIVSRKISSWRMVDIPDLLGLSLFMFNSKPPERNERQRMAEQRSIGELISNRKREMEKNLKYERK